MILSFCSIETEKSVDGSGLGLGHVTKYFNFRRVCSFQSKEPKVNIHYDYNVLPSHR